MTKDEATPTMIGQRSVGAEVMAAKMHRTSPDGKKKATSFGKLMIAVSIVVEIPTSEGPEGVK